MADKNVSANEKFGPSKVDPEVEAAMKAEKAAQAQRAKDVAAAMQNAPKKATVLKKAGGSIKKYARGGGIESRGKTKGRFV